MNRFLSRLAFAAAFSLPIIARADTFLSLELNGYAHDGRNPNILGRQVTGLFTLDTTTGTFVSGSLDSITKPYVFSADQYPPGPFLENDLDFSNTVDENGYSSEPDRSQFNILLVLNLPVGSLIGYQGGDICSESNFALCGQAGSVISLNSQEVLSFADGSLSPAPEPSSLILLGTGLVGLIGAVRREAARV